jgi:hypothetical protein
MKANPEPEKMSDAGCTMSEEKKGRKTGDRRDVKNRIID